MSIIFVILKYLAFAALTIVSMLLSYNMFSQLSSVPAESALLAVVAIAMEFLKIFSLVRGNTLWKLRLKSQAIRSWLLAVVLTMLSILASYGYNLVVVNRGIETANNSQVQLQIDANRAELEIVNQQVESLEAQIAVAVQRQQDTPYDYITAWRNITAQINELENSKSGFVQRQLELNTLYAQLQIDLANERAASRSTVTMFSLMAESFRMDPSVMMLLLLLTISVLIELGIVSSSPVIPIDKKHMKHILDEFAHNVDMKQIEAEQQIARAKRQKRIKHIYEKEHIDDPTSWPAVERRQSEQPAIPQEQPVIAEPEVKQEEWVPVLSNEDPTFFQALGSMFGKKKKIVPQVTRPASPIKATPEPHPRADEFIEPVKRVLEHAPNNASAELSADPHALDEYKKEERPDHLMEMISQIERKIAETSSVPPKLTPEEEAQKEIDRLNNGPFTAAEIEKKAKDFEVEPQSEDSEESTDEGHFHGKPVATGTSRVRVDIGTPDVPVRTIKHEVPELELELQSYPIRAKERKIVFPKPIEETAEIIVEEEEEILPQPELILEKEELQVEERKLAKPVVTEAKVEVENVESEKVPSEESNTEEKSSDTSNGRLDRVEPSGDTVEVLGKAEVPGIEEARKDAEVLKQVEESKPVRKRAPRKRVSKKVENVESKPSEIDASNTDEKSDTADELSKVEKDVSEDKTESDAGAVSVSRSTTTDEAKEAPVETEVVKDPSVEKAVEETKRPLTKLEVTEQPKTRSLPEPPKRRVATTDDASELHVGKISKPKAHHTVEEVGETRTYRFGKTTEDVKSLFIKFVNQLFAAETGADYLTDPDVAARTAAIKPGLAKVFIARLGELKGSTGVPLIQKKDDGFYYPNYTKEYIISYATKELKS